MDSRIQTRTAISVRLSDNVERLKRIFDNCTDILLETHRVRSDTPLCMFAVYCQSLTDGSTLHEVKRALGDLDPFDSGQKQGGIVQYAHYAAATFRECRQIATVEEAVDAVVNGALVLFFDGWDHALRIDAFNVETRNVDEPVSESVVMGPREGTVEDLHKNLGMLRRRLRDPRFKIESVIVGHATKTKVILGYLEGFVLPEVLDECRRRIGRLREEEILDTSHIEGLIEDSWKSPFPQFRYTERPDTAVAALLGGKIIVMVQGSGMIMIGPGLFVEFFQSAEDYYQRTLFSTLIRWLRLIAFFLALTLPSVYIALSTFHPELIPIVLLLAILNSREGIPFPALVEAMIMEFFFELLREAGIRLPRPVGSAVSIVGALIIGEAAIEAGIASPMMIVVVALTGIASFSIPQYNIAISLRILRFPLMVLAATLGGFGLMIGFLLILLHLCSLRSLGVPYLSPIAPLHPPQLGDVFVRAPLRRLWRPGRMPGDARQPRQ